MVRYTTNNFWSSVLKALCVQQPWAYALVDGVKSAEVRSWSTKHRGPLLICASARPKDMFWRNDTDDRLLPAGCMIGVVELIDCRPLVASDAQAAMVGPEVQALRNHYAWHVRSTGFCVPSPIKGKLNLFDVPDRSVQFLAAHEWLFDYEPPQGNVPFTERCGLFG